MYRMSCRPRGSPSSDFLDIFVDVEVDAIQNPGDPVHRMKRDRTLSNEQAMLGWADIDLDVVMQPEALP